jgi:DNA-directed RNA polymerase subunit delta
MKRIIVDYNKLNTEILDLLVEKFPDGYDDSDIISFRNAEGEQIEAVEIRTDDTIYLVKIGEKLQQAIQQHEEDNFKDDYFPTDDLSFDLD